MNTEIMVYERWPSPAAGGFSRGAERLDGSQARCPGPSAPASVRSHRGGSLRPVQRAPTAPPPRKFGLTSSLSGLYRGRSRPERGGLGTAFMSSTSLRAHVAAPPVEGQANSAVEQLLARTLGVKIAAVSLVRGEEVATRSRGSPR